MLRSPGGEPVPSRGSHLKGRAGDWVLLVPIENVLEVIPRVALRSLPGAPAGVRGVFDHRGAVAVVIDVRERFGMSAPTGAWNPFVVLDGVPRHALVLDAIDGFEDRAIEETIGAAMPVAHAAGLALYEGRSALVLRPAALLDAAELDALRGALDALAAGDLSR